MTLPFTKGPPGMWQATATHHGYRIEASIRRRQDDSPRYHTAVAVRRLDDSVVTTDSRGAMSWQGAASLARWLAARIIADADLLAGVRAGGGE